MTSTVPTKIPPRPDNKPHANRFEQHNLMNHWRVSKGRVTKPKDILSSSPQTMDITNGVMNNFTAHWKLPSQTRRVRSLGGGRSVEDDQEEDQEEVPNEGRFEMEHFGSVQHQNEVLVEQAVYLRSSGTGHHREFDQCAPLQETEHVARQDVHSRGSPPDFRPGGMYQRESMSKQRNFSFKPIPIESSRQLPPMNQYMARDDQSVEMAPLLWEDPLTTKMEKKDVHVDPREAVFSRDERDLGSVTIPPLIMDENSRINSNNSEKKRFNFQ